MNFCNFCGEPIGEREFCGEVCYQEYKEEMKVFEASRDEDLPGESELEG